MTDIQRAVETLKKFQEMQRNLFLFGVPFDPLEEHRILHGDPTAPEPRGVIKGGRPVRAAPDKFQAAVVKAFQKRRR